MIFPTVQFAFFFAVVLPLSWALMPRQRLWRPFILVASYYFYAAAGWQYAFLLAGSTVVNQTAATVITRQDSEKVRKVVLVAGIGVNLGALGFFKYLDFFSDTVSSSLGLSLGLLHLVLPIGVSFYTFQGISYLVDVHRRRTPLARPLDYAIYACFFPHLVAGPIVRASEFVPQLAGPRDPDRIPAARAFALIAGGLVKKMVVADVIGTRLVDPVFGTPQAHNGIETLMAVYGYAVQIYCDFSAYTDMAIGLALLLGFRFPDNFDRPYTARSLQDFWRRWHMTLSRWLRDYLYIPLGGNRGGGLKTYRNLMLTMVLGGLWHGAAWTFVVWGGIHGVGLAVERAWAAVAAAARISSPVPEAVRAAGARILTFHVVCLAWVFFRAPDVSTASAVLGRLFAGGPATGVLSPTVVLLIGVVLAVQWLPRGVGARLRTAFVTLPVYAQGVSLGVLILVIAAASGGRGVAPFIYFRF
ncbi:MAG: MBOAT family protein [Catenulispora sp.]|nr:MBOAT family protein [Catenulispora sp.]